MNKQLSPTTYKSILRFQQAEIDGSLLYARIANRQRDPESRRVLLEISREERAHYETWKGFTGKEVRPNRLKIAFFSLLSRILGYTFTIKYFEQIEDFGIRELKAIQADIPEARAIIAQEEEHEDRLLALMDEERLHYVGAIVLGLNDALVELTGTIAGLTFALANTRLVALSAIITGVSATLSMAASNYLAEQASGNPKALKSSLYTGVAYLITVTLLILPYLLLPNRLYLAALGIMLCIVVLIILAFNYYVSVAQSVPFGKRFLEMAAISLGVAAISFVIGILAKSLLGVDI